MYGMAYSIVQCIFVHLFRLQMQHRLATSHPTDRELIETEVISKSCS